MKLIPLSKGHFAQVDDEDFDSLNSKTWHVHEYPSGALYAEHTYREGSVTRTLRMHQVISGESGIDHRDGNGLNNQRSNFRSATRSEQSRNRRKAALYAGKAPSSTYKGVSRRLNRQGVVTGKWQAYFTKDGKWKTLGTFWSEEEAAKAYDKAAFAEYGEFARLNFPEDFGIIEADFSNAEANELGAGDIGMDGL